MTNFRLYLSIIIVIYPIFAQGLYDQTNNRNYNEQNRNYNEQNSNYDNDKHYSSPQMQQYQALEKKYCYTCFSIALLGPSAFGFPLEIPDRDYDVMGMRLNILFGEQKNLYGFDLGTYNYLSESLYGVQFGLLNIIHELGSKHSYGFQVGLGNFSRNDFTGIQTSIYNSSKNMQGLQIGFVNSAQRVKGVQIGVVNTCDKMGGIQIGLINFIYYSDIPLLPIINAQF